MKKLLSLLLLSPLAFADIKPLREYIASQDELGASEILYANYRCLGLFRMILNVTGGSSQGVYKNINSIVDANNKLLIEQTYLVWYSFEHKPKQAYFEDIKDIIPLVADTYQELANENLENTGAYFDGNELLGGYFKGNNLIVRDFQVCDELVTLFAD